jgi:hypothetical protein
VRCFFRFSFDRFPEFRNFYVGQRPDGAAGSDGLRLPEPLFCIRSLNFSSGGLPGGFFFVPLRTREVRETDYKQVKLNVKQWIH